MWLLEKGFFPLLSSCFYIFILHIEGKSFILDQQRFLLCIAFYFSSMLYLTGDISKKAEGQTFKFALKGCMCLNWTSTQTAIKVPFSRLSMARQHIATLQIPKENPSEQSSHLRLKFRISVPESGQCDHAPATAIQVSFALTPWHCALQVGSLGSDSRLAWKGCFSFELPAHFERVWLL